MNFYLGMTLVISLVANMVAYSDNLFFSPYKVNSCLINDTYSLVVKIDKVYKHGFSGVTLKRPSFIYTKLPVLEKTPEFYIDYKTAERMYLTPIDCEAYEQMDNSK